MRVRLAIVCVVLMAACGAFVVAQPPAGRDGPPPPVVGDPLRGALDVNHDHELDADEIAQAAKSLAKLDRNGDGRIDHEEFRPPFGPPPGAPGERGFDRRPPGPPGESGGRPPRDFRPPEGERNGPPRGEGRPPR
ncbi:MAG: hypothetical protein ACKOTB_12970, partial [Planctomycetia bacterium]